MGSRGRFPGCSCIVTHWGRSQWVIFEEMLMANTTIGIIAHVDAGKTTLSEALLYLSGTVRTLGRVDKGDAFLDTFRLERQRGTPSSPSKPDSSCPGAP